MEPVAEQGNRDTGPLSLDQAAEAFARIRKPVEATPDAGQAPAPAEDAADEATASEAATDADETATGDDLEAGDDAESGPEQPEEEPQRFPVKVDGKEIEVTLDELTRGYQRLSDYTRKTQEVAAERRQLESFAAQLQQAQQYLAQRAEEIERLAGPAEQEPDWQALVENDPLEAFKQRMAWEAKAKQRDALRAEKLRLEQAKAAQEAEQLRAYVEAQRARLPEVVPEWRDQKVRAKETAEIRQYMTKELGLPAEYDFVEPWQVKAIRDAWLGYRARTAQATARDKLAAAKPGPVMRSGPPARVDAARQSQSAAAMAQLKRTGRPEDAAAVFARLRKG